MNHAIEIVSNTIESCESFTTLILEENELLKSRDMEAVEGKIKEKRSLAAKLEKLLTTLKASYIQIQQNSEAMAQIPKLEVVMDNYKTASRKNTALLHAAHTATTDFINLVRHAVEVKKPKSRVYGENGTMREQSNTTNLVDKDI